MQQLSHHINLNLGQHAQLLFKLERLVKSALPLSAQDHVSIANIHDKELVLATDSPAWSTRLRLHSREILYLLSTNTNLNISSVRVRLLKQVHTKPAKTPFKPRFLSSNSAQLLTQTAETITDPALKQALLKLAQRKLCAD